MSDNEDILDYFEEFDYVLNWEETPLGHITGRLWEAEVSGGIYVIRRLHGTTVEGHFEAGPDTILPDDKSKLLNFWIEGADHYKSNKEEGWIKAEQAEHLCRLWCEDHAMRNLFVKDVRQKDAKPLVDPGELSEATKKMIAHLRGLGHGIDAVDHPVSNVDVAAGDFMGLPGGEP